MLKAGVQRAIGLLPHSHRWNELFQRYVTHSLGLDRRGFESRLGHSARHLRHFADLRPDKREPASALEVGTGWYPVVAVALYLCGAERVWTVDIAQHLTRESVQRVLHYFCDYAEVGELRRQLPRVRPERIDALKALRTDPRGPKALLRSVGIEAMVGDARRTGLQNGSIDLFYSTAVLEYIPFPVLVQIFREFHRLASPAGAMSHYIDLKDQYSAIDSTITPYNFLRYSRTQWRRFDSPLTSQSRLRISDYRAAFDQGGWELRSEAVDRGDPPHLQGLRLAPEFRRYVPADLLVQTAWMSALPRQLAWR